MIKGLDLAPIQADSIHEEIGGEAAAGQEATTGAFKGTLHPTIFDMLVQVDMLVQGGNQMLPPPGYRQQEFVVKLA